MRKPFTALLGIAGLTLMSFTGSNEEAVDYATIARIKHEAFNNSQVMETLFQITDVNGPRLTGSPGMRKAEEWAANQMKEWGLANVAAEPWGAFGKSWELKKSYAAIKEPYYIPLIGVAKAWAGSTKGLVHGDAMLVQIDGEKDFAKYGGRLKGKMIIINHSSLEIKPNFAADAKRRSNEDLEELSMDSRLDDIPAKRSNMWAQRLAAINWRKKVDSFFLAEQAQGIISCRRGTMGTVFTSNGSSYEPGVPTALPEMEVSMEHIGHITRLLERGMPVTIEMDIQTAIDNNPTMEYNVVAEIPGADKKLKNEVVMLGAHLDSWHGATGATDNGAGAAVMMEVIRILKALNIQPRRTIRVILWSGEEQGLLGSKGYVHKHFGDTTMRPKPEYAQADVYYNLDNGAGKIRGVFAQGNDEVKPIFEAWLAPFRDLGATTVTIRNTGSTDHIPFDERQF